MRFFYATILVTALACGKVNVGLEDSKHTVEHKVTLDDVFLSIEKFCRDNYTDPEDVLECKENLLDSITNLIDGQEGE